MADNPPINMQDKRPADVVCSKCGRIILKATLVESYRQRDIDQIVSQHVCAPGDESKRDFHDEVR